LFFLFRESKFQKMEKAGIFDGSVRSNAPAKHTWIRTDGDRHLGFGHLLRCQALAAYLPEFTFLISESSMPFLPQGIPYLNVGSDFSVAEAEHLSSLIQPGDLLVVDSYKATPNYVHAARSLGLQTLQINDLPQMALPVDVLLNHCPGLSPADFPANPHTDYWLGLEYRLLRPEFQQPSAPFNSAQPPHLFVCFGGTDGGSLIRNALDWAAGLSPTFRVSAVVADPQSHVSSIFPGLTLHSNLNAAQMKSLIADCTLAWVPSSTLALECLVAGLPMIIGMTADNQAFLHRGLQQFPAVASIDSWHSVHPRALIELSQQMGALTPGKRPIPPTSQLPAKLHTLLF